MAWSAMRGCAVSAAALVLLSGVGSRPARACDVCAVYVATELRESSPGPWLGAAEQLSRFQTLQRGGNEIAGGGQQLTSSVTQLLVGYDFIPELGVQVTVPLIVRDFRRPVDGTWQVGHENGLGDVSLLATYRPISHMDGETMFRVSLLGGIELPTGSTDRIAEEIAEDDHAMARAVSAIPRHEDEPHEGFPPSGVHGHDLALGSGSVDGIIGGQVFASWYKFFATAGVQYAIRGTGDFDYRYANELTFGGGPGIFAILEHDYTFSVQLGVSGEWKENDTVDGVETDDTAITALYLGPALAFTWGNSLGATFAIDLPVNQQNSSVQLVPDFRLRGGLTWRL